MNRELCDLAPDLCGDGQPCLRCQARSVQLRREVVALRSESVAVPPRLFEQIMIALDDASRSRRLVAAPTPTVAAALGGVAAAAGAVAFAVRRRSSVRLAG